MEGVGTAFLGLLFGLLPARAPGGPRRPWEQRRSFQSIPQPASPRTQPSCSAEPSRPILTKPTGAPLAPPPSLLVAWGAWPKTYARSGRGWQGRGEGLKGQGGGGKDREARKKESEGKGEPEGEAEGWGQRGAVREGAAGRNRRRKQRTRLRALRARLLEEPI
jgi:hypothetical protein